MGSNQGRKRQVAQGKLCYICEKVPPALVDEVGGRICKKCDEDIQAMRLSYALRGGYIQRERTNVTI